MIDYIVFLSPTSFLKLFILGVQSSFCYLNCFLMTHISKASGEISLGRTQSERARPKALVKNRKHFPSGIWDILCFNTCDPIASCTSSEFHLSLKAKLKSQVWKSSFDLSSSWWLLSLAFSLHLAILHLTDRFIKYSLTSLCAVSLSSLHNMSSERWDLCHISLVTPLRYPVAYLWPLI